MKCIKVTKENENQRIDKLVRKYLNLAPLSFIYKTFRKKDVKVNNHWVNGDYIVKLDDEIKIYVTDEQLADFSKPKEVKKSDIKLDIIYEDDNILIINKPVGLLVVEDENEKSNTLTNFVQSYLFTKGEFKNNGLDFRPSPVHRLDRNTSGVCIYAKNLFSSQQLIEMFKSRTNIDKFYLALVLGKPQKNEGCIDAPLIKDPKTKIVKVARMERGSLSAKTEYKVICSNSELSLLKVHLLTGRTHQIRVHLAYINCPIVGDAKYGDFSFNKEFYKKYKFENQFLHSYKVTFGKIEGKLSYLSGKSFLAKLPKNEDEILDSLKFNYCINKL